jgi:iron complex outermembrane receptor protein
MIERVEVLREGAAAQYGSDAIAGVINIVLKSTDPGQVSATLGQVSSSVDGFDYSDGEVMHGAASFGRAVGQAATSTSASSTATAGSPTAPVPTRARSTSPATRATPRRWGSRCAWGDAETRDGLGFLNTAYTFAGGAQAYASGG